MLQRRQFIYWGQTKKKAVKWEEGKVYFALFYFCIFVFLYFCIFVFCNWGSLSDLDLSFSTILHFSEVEGTEWRKR